MVKDAALVWEKCLEIIQGEVSSQNIKIWFEPIKAVKVTEQVLTLQVPNRFVYEYLEDHFFTILKKAIRSQLGVGGRLEYQILMPGPNNIHARRSKRRENDVLSVNLSKNETPNPFVIPGIKKAKIESNLNPKYTFDNFIEGDCNKLARSAGYAIAKKPGGTAFNPLVIFGDSGLGKTHLAQAIGNEIQQNFSDKNVLYLTSTEFMNQFIKSIKENMANDFVNFYQMIDVLIIDDIQFLKSGKKTQDIFFHIFNQLHQLRKQIVITSDRPPIDLDGLEERLISRFKWGLTADLQAPEYETRMAILEEKMQNERIQFPQEVKELICFHIENNVRELEGVIVNLLAQSSFNGKNIDVALAKDVIKSSVRSKAKEISIANILEIVADYFQVEVSKIKGRLRKRPIVIARQTAMYFSKNMTNESLKSIGMHFGGKDHSTVIYSCSSVQDMMDIDPEFKAKINDLEKRIRMSLG